MATIIAKKSKGDFDTYFFVIENFVKHVNAKGYNRHVARGAMQPSELLSVGQEALGLLLLKWDQNHQPCPCLQRLCWIGCHLLARSVLQGSP
jgi:hypothetical protein